MTLSVASSSGSGNDASVSPNAKRVITSAAVCAVVVAALGIAAALGAFSLGAKPSVTADPPSAFIQPHVPPGVVPRQSALAIELRVRKSLGPHARITSVVVVAHRRQISRVIGGSGPEIDRGGPAWIVRARGLFHPVTIPPGGSDRMTQRNGYVVIDDMTGNMLAYGFG
jgi:hypothetical protein